MTPDDTARHMANHYMQASFRFSAIMVRCQNAGNRTLAQSFDYHANNRAAVAVCWWKKTRPQTEEEEGTL